MKIIQILIAALALLYANLNGTAQTEKDTVKIIFKGNTYNMKTSIEPEEEERKRTLKFIDTLKKTMVLITVKTKSYDGKKWDSQEEAIYKDSNENANLQKKIVNLMNKQHSKERKHFIETSLLPTLDLGFTSTMNELENSNTFTPKLTKSANINIGIVRQNMNLYNGKVLFSYGLNLNNYYMKYNNKQMVQYIDNKGLLNSYLDTINNFDKNRLDIRYLTIPVLLEYHSKNDKFGIAAGIEFGFNGFSKLTLKGDKESLEFKQKNGTDVKISPEQLNALLRINIYEVTIYGRYSITDMYRPSAFIQGNNSHQHLFSVGICLFGI